MKDQLIRLRVSVEAMRRAGPLDRLQRAPLLVDQAFALLELMANEIDRLRLLEERRA